MKKSKMLLIIMAICLIIPLNCEAAGKVKLSSTKKTVEVGKTVKISLKNNKKKVKWSVSNGKIKIVKKTNKYAKIKGVKKGSATLKAKVGKKIYKCKITIKNPNKKNNDTSTSFNKKSAEKNITKNIYSLNNKLFVLLNSNYEVPTSITANCYFFDSNGNPVGDSYSYCFWLEKGKEGLLTFSLPDVEFASYDIKYNFFQSFAYIGNESIINNLTIDSNVANGTYSNNLMLTLSNGSNKVVSSCSVIIKYYDNSNNLLYFDKVYFYNVKPGDYSIESVYPPNINYEHYKLCISTATYDK